MQAFLNKIEVVYTTDRSNLTHLYSSLYDFLIFSCSNSFRVVFKVAYFILKTATFFLIKLPFATKLLCQKYILLRSIRAKCWINQNCLKESLNVTNFAQFQIFFNTLMTFLPSLAFILQEQIWSRVKLYD